MKGLVIIFASVLVVLVGISVMQKSIKTSPENMPQVQGVSASPEHYDLGEVPMSKGTVTKTFEVTNNSGQAIKLKKIVTSCMCTQAKVSVDGKETAFFGMEHAGDFNAPVNLEIPAGKSATATVVFDPAAHGPQGVGPFDRTIWLTFTDPAGVKELTFDGVVTP